MMIYDMITIMILRIMILNTIIMIMTTLAYRLQLDAFTRVKKAAVCVYIYIYDCVMHTYMFHIYIYI